MQGSNQGGERAQGLRTWRKMSQRQLGALIANAPLFARLSPEARQRLQVAFRIRAVSPGESLIKQGELGQHLWLLLQGEVEVFYAEEGAFGSTRIARLGPGDLFGEISLLSRSPATATVSASQASHLLELSGERFEQICQEHPELRARLQDLSGERLAENRFVFEDDTFIESAD